ncbi:MAG: hypothetical protein ACRCSF_04180 [Mycobacteriaceae bacterium]
MNNNNFKYIVTKTFIPQDLTPTDSDGPTIISPQSYRTQRLQKIANDEAAIANYA